MAEHLTFETLTHFAHLWGLVLFVLAFVGIVAYVLWPGKRADFQRAAHIPLDDDDAPPADEAHSSKT